MNEHKIRLFKKLFNRCSGYIELRAFPSKKRVFISLAYDWQTIREQADKFCQDYKDQNIYFGVATRDGKKGTDGKKGAEGNIISIPCVWVEIDYKNIPKEKVQEIIDKFPYKPTIITKTGGGVHLYFLLEKPVDLKRSTDVRKVNDWIRLELNKLGGCKLDDITDIPRILRLPGTINFKYPHKPLCEVVEINDNTYKLDDFIEKIPRALKKSSPEREQDKKPLRELYGGTTEGHRNTDLTRLAGSWVSDKLTFEECLEHARIWNTKNVPPLPEEEIVKVIKSIQKSHELKTQEISNTFNCTDLGNSLRLIKRYRDIIRFCYAWKKWLVWKEESGTWQVDNNGMILRLAKGVVKNIYKEATAIAKEEQRKIIAGWAVKSESLQHLQAMVKLAESEENIPISPNELDADPWLLNCLNGTINLKTGELKEHNKNDFNTKVIPVEYDIYADYPMWLDFLEKITNKNYDLIDFLKRAIGYSLTGKTSEQYLFMMHGFGANGKSTFLNIISALLGDYAQTASFDSFLIKKYNTISNDVARMQGRRFISAVEAEGERHLAEVLVKQITGGDTISARFLYGEFFEFVPQFKLWLACNHKPVIRGTDNAIWRRIKLIPFNVQIPEEEQDKELSDKLKKEMKGILSWAVQGCLEWQTKGLKSPDEVKEATNNYRSEMDEIGIFLTECCIINPNVKANPTDLYNAYKKWCEDTGESALTMKAFGIRLTERGLNPSQTGGKRFRNGVGLLEKRTACTT